MLDYYRTLMADEVRTRRFRAALAQLVRPDDVVLDLGCGPGILSFFACELGARRVFAIDEGHAADAAEMMAKHLGYEDRMEVFHANSRDVTLPERATLLVTETLGVLGFEEHILGSINDARARLLTADARVIPRAVTLSFVPVTVPDVYEATVAWWSTKPYGIELAPLRTYAANSVQFARLKAESFLASPAETITYDLGSSSGAAIGGRADFVAARDGVLHGFGAWFNATLADGIHLSTFDDVTHWSHAFLPIEEPIAVSAGMPITLEVESLADGTIWLWRGTAGAQTFEQCSAMRMPPCRKPNG
jgi:SAM-dependent methyltransferase